MGSDDDYLETRQLPTQKGFCGRPEKHNGRCPLLSWVLHHSASSIVNYHLIYNVYACRRLAEKQQEPHPTTEIQMCLSMVLWLCLVYYATLPLLIFE